VDGRISADNASPRCPDPHNEETEVEIRPVFEAEDFGAEFTPELREQEQRIREQAAAR